MRFGLDGEKVLDTDEELQTKITVKLIFHVNLRLVSRLPPSDDIVNALKILD